jgi:aldehyde:ferredoxin oxidoreductase
MSVQTIRPGFSAMKIVTVDLSSGNIKEEQTAPDLASQFVGGRGVNTYILFRHSPSAVDPLSPDCPIIFGTGPLTGYPFPMGGRFVATTKSPLTGTICTSSCGGRLGVSLKKCGIDFIVLKGKAPAPSYISVNDSGVSVQEASSIWRRDKATAKEWLRKRHGTHISIALIGQAGESLVPFANIENDGRFLGRGGLGATLGSKNIKALVIQGNNNRLTIPDREHFDFVRYESQKWLAANPITSRGLPQYGTAVLVNYMQETGLLPARNFSALATFDSSNLSGELLAQSFLRKRKACPFCPVACGRVTPTGEGPEYETLWALGANLAIHDLEKVIRLGNLCNELGIDSITTGVTIGTAIELSEKGLLKLDVTFGDFQGVESLIKQIAERNGQGGLLSQGSKELCRSLGSPETAPQVKGLELPAYDPRGAYGHALGYATSNRGGCHMQGYMIGTEVLGIPKLVNRFSVVGKASLLCLYQNVSAFMDTLVMCRFSSYAIPHDHYSRILSAVTDRRISWEDSLRVGARIWNLERLFNLREGVEKDSLPDRFSDVPLDTLLCEYYDARGWDSEGRPRSDTLSTLGLLW